MIIQMVEFLKYYDIVIGSGFVMGGGMARINRDSWQCCEIIPNACWNYDLTDNTNLSCF